VQQEGRVLIGLAKPGRTVKEGPAYGKGKRIPLGDQSERSIEGGRRLKILEVARDFGDEKKKTTRRENQWGTELGYDLRVLKGFLPRGQTRGGSGQRE